MNRFAGLLLLAIVTGCADQRQAAPSASDDPIASPSPSVGASAVIDPAAALATVTCGGPPFPVELLSRQEEAQDADDPAAAALRDLFTTPEGRTFLPRSGWTLAVRTATTAFYIADASPTAEAPFAHAEVELRDGRWQMAGFGDCWPMVDVGPDLGLAEFVVDRGATLTPETTHVPVLVTERACTGAASSEDRIVAPAIIESDASVIVVFAVVPLEGGVFTCPSNPATSLVLELPSPLGDRVLLDGSSVPPRDATVCARGGGCP